MNFSSAKELVNLKPSDKSHVQLIRSLVVSVVALIFDFSTMVVFKELLDLNYILAVTIGFSAGVIVNYYLSVIWVFADHKLNSKKAEFTIFTIICIVGLLLNIIIIAGLVEAANTDYRVAKGLSTVIVFFWNFLARKRLLY